ncbi:phosphate ABC transporter permease subunit PstC [Vannielia litorea]|uniref:phosphate ABC transporter permease subunit PstC n=1 Tax=Vannielia litorea TaxID=1217970 RepID=UPI001C979732|nr:phosphate ABC transporter permease subunit PstC [Vannielia litorea]MBY6047192.1 phosphate ABC transporter permease subunit PstC [Vannielia litorea]MBY6074606.1 phosphate ABC transporter permease subunit PstC [Vannielia litorea]
MPVLWIFLIVLGIGALGYVVARQRALASVGNDPRHLHSLPSYYGYMGFLFATAPALLVLIVWLIAGPMVIEKRVAANLPADVVEEAASQNLLMAEVRRVADGLDNAVAMGVLTEGAASNARADLTDMTARLKEAGQVITQNVTVPVLLAAQEMRQANRTSKTWMAVAVIALAVAGAALAVLRAQKDFRARNVVERGVRWMLVGAASIAILTTVGIVLSLLFNTIEFFRIYPASEFFGSLTWSPSFGGGSELGIWPLLWGTLYISIIALLVAVPIGLFAAIYLSEYASPRLRSVAKPLLEILAGIPTIVYGLFALLTVGPLLISVFGDNGLGWMQSGTAVMTAGLVMGIMLIPFVSSLSDDIINAVPQAMRDGSYGLGATQSETIRQVVLPAALPGIVGAVLLAASRAIGETMIVVLGAGAAARLSLNPFEAMTTVTAKIVSQLTGDADFASPEALVAFALGMTLFIITLCLNVFALYIVRKYREQYD